MGIILKNLKTQKIIFYIKGADFVMRKLVPEVKRGFLMDECDELSRSGLRTLVFGFKVLKEEEYDIWSEEYEKANTSLQNRERNIEEVVSKLERNVQLLTITGVED